MHEDIPTKAIAACIGLAGFVIAVLVGVLVDNPFEVVLTRALAAMFVCSLLGYIVGTVTTRVVSRALEQAAEAAKAAAAAAVKAPLRVPAATSSDGAQPGGASAPPA